MDQPDWWFVSGNKRHGPISANDLEAKLLAEELSLTTRVWRRGMGGWCKVHEVEELAEIVRNLPPPIDPEATEVPSEPDPEPPPLPVEATEKAATIEFTYAAKPKNQAGSWSRFFARQTDVLILGYAGWVFIGAKFGDMINFELLNNRAVDVMLTLPIALLLEIPLMALTGTTIGKLIFGIKIRNFDDSKLSFIEVTRRNLSIWLKGYGLGIPLVSLVTLWMSYSNASDGKKSSWDTAELVNVRQSNVGWFRKTVGICFFFALLVAAQSTDRILRAYDQHVAARYEQPIIWKNPLTQTSAVLPWGWKLGTTPANSPDNTFWFESKKSVVIFGREIASRVSLSQYVQALRQNVDYGKFETQWSDRDSRGVSFITLQHTKTSQNSSFKVEVKVWRTTQDQYWRVVTFSPINDSEELSDARATANLLLGSSFFEQGRKIPDGSLADRAY